jgi:predicted nucleic acid-binding protein
VSDCVVDTTLLISLGKVGALHILTSSTAHIWHITPIVRGEVVSRETREGLEQAIVSGRIRPSEMDLSVSADSDALAKWARLVDPGEAEAIAVAEVRGWRIATEDRQAQRAVQRELGVGRWINSANLLVDGVRGNRVTIGDANEIFRRLDCYSAYSKRGIESIEKLL